MGIYPTPEDRRPNPSRLQGRKNLAEGLSRPSIRRRRRTAERRTCTARGRGRPKIFHCLFSKPGTEDREATLAGCQERRFAVVKPIIAKRENKALSSSDQP